MWRKIKQSIKNTEMPYYKTTLNGKYSIVRKTEDPKEGEKILSEEYKFKEMHFETKEISKEMYKYLNV